MSDEMAPSFRRWLVAYHREDDPDRHRSTGRSASPQAPIPYRTPGMNRRRRARRHRIDMSTHPSQHRCSICGDEKCWAHCAWCGLVGAHDDGCPEVTNMYPVTVYDIGLRCGFCAGWFDIGECFCWLEVPGDDIDIWVVACVGCAALRELGV